MGHLPFTTSYEVARDDFRAATEGARSHRSLPIAARGPGDGELTIDVAVLGSPRPDRALFVMAGVHGVEGFACSPIMIDAAERWVDTQLPDEVGVVLVHAVNPWGMAWQRRQNESNVDLNRNWGAGSGPAPDNPGYRLLHAALCPDGDLPPDADSFFEVSGPLVAEHGEAWVRAAVSNGQATHPDGLYFAGTEIEESTNHMAAIAAEALSTATDVLAVDLHTGFGPRGAMTLLARFPAGSDGDRRTRSIFPDVAVHNTVTSAEPVRHGQIASGLADVVPGARWHAVTAELGTRSDVPMILAERAEHWVHRFGDRAHPDHAAIVEHHLRCSTPDDPVWQAAAIEHGRRVLDDALAAVVEGR